MSIVMSRLHSGSRQFSNATVLSQRPGYSNQNPVLFHDKVTDRVYLFHSQQEAGKGEGQLSSGLNDWLVGLLAE